MNTEEALAILDEVFSERVAATSPTWSRQVSLSFSEGEPPTAHMNTFDEDECTGSAWQRLEVLPPIADAATVELLWSILAEQSTSDAAALRLVAESRIEAIPLLVVLLDAWVDRGVVQTPECFLGGENGHTKLARLLEPLVRRTEDASYLSRIEGMAEAGLFRLE